MPPPEKKEFAVVGLQHAHSMAAVKELLERGWRVASVWDDEPDFMAGKFAAEHRAPLSSDGDFCQAVERTDAQLIVSSIRLDLRGALVTAALKAGKAVITDKPFCTTLADCAAVEGAAKSSKVAGICQFEFRYHPVVRAVYRRYLAGELGKMVGFLGLGPHKLNPQTRPAWFFKEQYNPGVLVDLCCHMVDLFFWFGDAGRDGSAVPAFVGGMEGATRWGALGLTDFGQADIRLADGAVACCRGDWLAPAAYPRWGDSRFLLTGTEGQAEVLFQGAPDAVGAPLGVWYSDRAAPERLTAEPLTSRDGKKFGKEASFIAEFLAYAFEGEPTHLTLADCLRTTRATIQARTAAKKSFGRNDA
jgi:predicted dehydrogenase